MSDDNDDIKAANRHNKISDVCSLLILRETNTGDIVEDLANIALILQSVVAACIGYRCEGDVDLQKATLDCIVDKLPERMAQADAIRKTFLKSKAN